MGLLLAGAAQAEIGSSRLEGYFQYIGRPNFFYGRLLTAEDLAGEQDYQRQKDRFLPDLDLTLLEMFEPAGRIDVTLFYEQDDVMDGQEPTDPAQPRLDDFILLDDTTGQWVGLVYLFDPPGVYELHGTFAVPQPGVANTLPIGLGLIMSRRPRLHRPRK